MDYYVKSVIPVIESNYENFTALEKNIADFFMKNEEKMDFSAKEIAKHLFVLRKNVGIMDIKNLFINMRNHLKRKIKNSRDIQEQC